MKYQQTHLIYAFAGLSSKFELKAFDPYNDINQGEKHKLVMQTLSNAVVQTNIRKLQEVCWTEKVQQPVEDDDRHRGME